MPQPHAITVTDKTGATLGTVHRHQHPGATVEMPRWWCELCHESDDTADLAVGVVSLLDHLEAEHPVGLL